MPDKLHKAQQRKRKQSLIKSTKELQSAFINADGLKRLVGLSPDEWQKAAEKDAAEGESSDAA
jgi:hypothetical protein